MDICTDSLALETSKADNFATTLNFRIFNTLGGFLIAFIYIGFIPENKSTGWEWIFIFIAIFLILIIIFARNLNFKPIEVEQCEIKILHCSMQPQ